MNSESKRPACRRCGDEPSVFSGGSLVGLCQSCIENDHIGVNARIAELERERENYMSHGVAKVLSARIAELEAENAELVNCDEGRVTLISRAEPEQPLEKFEQLVNRVGTLPTTGLAGAEQPKRVRRVVMRGTGRAPLVARGVSVCGDDAVNIIEISNIPDGWAVEIEGDE